MNMTRFNYWKSLRRIVVEGKGPLSLEEKEFPIPATSRKRKTPVNSIAERTISRAGARVRGARRDSKQSPLFCYTDSNVLLRITFSFMIFFQFYFSASNNLGQSVEMKA